VLLLPFRVCAQTSAPQGFSSPVITTADAARSIRANRESIQDQVNVLLARLAMPQVVHVAIVHTRVSIGTARGPHYAAS
jgi:hypothetical protein